MSQIKHTSNKFYLVEKFKLFSLFLGINMGGFMDNLKLYWSKTNRFHRALFIFLVIELHILPSGKLGFYCKDPALSHPFTGDTISWKWLMAVCLSLPLTIMLIVERKLETTDKEKKNRRALNWYKEYLFGYILNLIVVQSLKSLVGSPRPHFFDTCMPKEASTCQESEYVSSYTCTKSYWIFQSNTSFPSGHTSLAIHAGFFSAYYLYKRLPSSTITRIVQCLCIGLALWCSVSRMIDHRHHWWDVLAGAIIGFALLFYTTHRLCKQFDCSTKSDVKDDCKDSTVPLMKTLDM